MQAKKLSKAAGALSAHVEGTTLELSNHAVGPLVGATQVDPVPGGDHDLAGIPDASIDAIVSQGGVARLCDPVLAIQQWRRVLREGGTLALAWDEGPAPTWLVSLLNRIGGFDVQIARPIEGVGGWIVVAHRHAVHDVRSPLGVLAPELAQAANGSAGGRSELYFQLGSLLLQSGDPELGQRCFASMLQLEPDNADALFGLGMCQGALQRWSEALTQLERAQSLDPSNPELQRWIDLARRNSAPAPAAAVPVPVAASIPAPTRPSVEPRPEPVGAGVAAAVGGPAAPAQTGHRRMGALRI